MQVLDAAELDFSRYGDVLFEVAFAGARLTTGGNVATEGKKLNFNVSALNCLGQAGMMQGALAGAAAAASPCSALLLPPRRARRCCGPAPACPPLTCCHTRVQILAGPADREEILFYIKWFQAMIR